MLKDVARAGVGCLAPALTRVYPGDRGLGNAVECGEGSVSSTGRESAPNLGHLFRREFGVGSNARKPGSRPLSTPSGFEPRTHTRLAPASPMNACRGVDIRSREKMPALAVRLSSISRSLALAAHCVFGTRHSFEMRRIRTALSSTEMIYGQVGSLSFAKRDPGCPLESEPMNIISDRSAPESSVGCQPIALTALTAPEPTGADGPRCDRKPWIGGEVAYKRGGNFWRRRVGKGRADHLTGIVSHSPILRSDG